MIDFYKFDGAGNDFIIVDLRSKNVRLTTEQIARMCHRRFGVGADGLMTLSSPGQCTTERSGDGSKDVACEQPKTSVCNDHNDSNGIGYDFKMQYYNSDGLVGSMCGNGGRCIAAFAHVLGIKPLSGKTACYHFLGFDGPHDAEILIWDANSNMGLVRLGMKDVAVEDVRRVKDPELGLDGWMLDTGSPHFVQRVEHLDKYDVFHEGRRIRNISSVFPRGTNVDFIETLENGTLSVRTYERGVENETWACGTGVTASALVSGVNKIRTHGGDFKVTFDASGQQYQNIQLTGPVSLNFTGSWKV